jgi:hypothetical protein
MGRRRHHPPQSHTRTTRSVPPPTVAQPWERRQDPPNGHARTGARTSRRCLPASATSATACSRMSSAAARISAALTHNHIRTTRTPGPRGPRFNTPLRRSRRWRPSPNPPCPPRRCVVTTARRGAVAAASIVMGATAAAMGRRGAYERAERQRAPYRRLRAHLLRRQPHPCGAPRQFRAMAAALT